MGGLDRLEPRQQLDGAVGVPFTLPLPAPNQANSHTYPSEYGISAELNVGDGTDTNCGAWGLTPNEGDTSWVHHGGRIFLR